MQQLRFRQPGFTLIELMIAVVVVGVLVALAYPSYIDSVRKGRRADAVKGVSAVQLAQERWRSNRPAYASALSDLGLSSSSAGPNYDLALSDVTATGYTVTATGKTGTSQANDTRCVRMRSVIDAGNIAYHSAPATGGWDTTDAARCWAK